MASSAGLVPCFQRYSTVARIARGRRIFCFISTPFFLPDPPVPTRSGGSWWDSGIRHRDYVDHVLVLGRGVGQRPVPGQVERDRLALEQNLRQHLARRRVRNLYFVRLLRDYVNYHHDDRIHDALEKDTPNRRPVERKPNENSIVVAMPRRSKIGARIVPTDGPDHNGIISLGIRVASNGRRGPSCFQETGG